MVMFSNDGAKVTKKVIDEPGKPEFVAFRNLPP
jgi:hypothetical protein